LTKNYTIHLHNHNRERSEKFGVETKS